MARLNRILGTRASVPLLRSGQLNPDFVALYGLSPAAEDQLQDVVRTSLRRMRQLEAENAIITAGKAAGSFQISMPPLPKAGGALYDQFLASVRQVLGSDRARYFDSGRNLNDASMLGAFGLSTENILLRTAPTPHPTETWESHVDPATGILKVQETTDLVIFEHQWPELYQRMVQAVQWSGTP